MFISDNVSASPGRSRKTDINELVDHIGPFAEGAGENDE
jgi:hypothetical protein